MEFGISLLAFKIFLKANKINYKYFNISLKYCRGKQYILRTIRGGVIGRIVSCAKATSLYLYILSPLIKKTKQEFFAMNVFKKYERIKNETHIPTLALFAHIIKCE